MNDVEEIQTLIECEVNGQEETIELGIVGDAELLPRITVTASELVLTLDPSDTRTLAEHLWAHADRAETIVASLLPCHECDADPMMHRDTSEVRYQVRCTCGVSGPVRESWYRASTRWNDLMRSSR